MQTKHAEIALLNFDVKGDERGSLIALESCENIPFPIRRVYYIFETQKNVVRGKHAHHQLKQILVPVHGSCKIRLEIQDETRILELDDPSCGLYLEGLVWHELYDFTPGTVLLALADKNYDESDYIRNYHEFLEWQNFNKELVS